MACRIHNLGKHRLALDLRGGKVVYLQPNEISQPLREEWLYGNVHLPVWLEQGLVRRIDAKMAEVVAHEAAAAAAEAPAPAPAQAQGENAKDSKDGKEPRGKSGKDDGAEGKLSA